MADTDLAGKIEADLRVLIRSQTIIDFSQQDEDDPDPVTELPLTELTARTTKVAQKAAAKIQGRLGGQGVYDDVLEPTDPDQAEALELGNRYALMTYSQLYGMRLTETALQWIGGINDDLERAHEDRNQRRSAPVIARQPLSPHGKRGAGGAGDILGLG